MLYKCVRYFRPTMFSESDPQRSVMLYYVQWVRHATIYDGGILWFESQTPQQLLMLYYVLWLRSATSMMIYYDFRVISSTMYDAILCSQPVAQQATMLKWYSTMFDMHDVDNPLSFECAQSISLPMSAVCPSTCWKRSTVVTLVRPWPWAGHCFINHIRVLWQS